MEYQRPKTELKKAIVYMLLAALFTTIMILFVKLVAQYVSIPIILFARYLLTLLLVLPFIFLNPLHEPVVVFLKTKRFKLHLFRDVLGFISLSCYFYAAKYISLADATVLFNTAPLFIPIVAFFWGRMKIFHNLWWGMGIGFLGVILVLNPGQELFHYTAVIGLISGVLASIVFVGGRYLAYSEPSLRNMFYYFLIDTLLASLLLLVTGINFASLLDAKVILLLASIGICGFLYQFCFTLGCKYAPLRLTSSFMYTSVIFSLILDWWIWGVVPSMISFIGIILIILGAFLLLFLYPKDDFVKRPNPSR